MMKRCEPLGLTTEVSLTVFISPQRTTRSFKTPDADSDTSVEADRLSLSGSTLLAAVSRHAVWTEAANPCAEALIEMSLILTDA